MGKDPLKVIPDFWIEMSDSGEIESIAYIDSESGEEMEMDRGFTLAVEAFSNYMGLPLYMFLLCMYLDGH